MGAAVSEKVFLGVVTCGRDDYLRQVVQGIEDHLLGVIDTLVLYHDGAPSSEFDNIASQLPCVWSWRRDRRGVGAAKNELLRAGLESGADWIFTLEDDVIPQSPEAITGYILAAKKSGLGHLAFHGHGPANDRGPVETIGRVTTWPHFVGAFCLYSRLSLETCGLMDEAFVNSWDHVEHTLRLSLAGFHPLPPEPYELRAADATGSENWLKEIPGSIENTSIPHTEQWKVDRARGREHWKATRPESYYLVFSR
jgi:GT2 family glycosyltransferase